MYKTQSGAMRMPKHAMFMTIHKGVLYHPRNTCSFLQRHRCLDKKTYDNKFPGTGWYRGITLCKSIQPLLQLLNKPGGMKGITGSMMNLYG